MGRKAKRKHPQSTPTGSLDSTIVSNPPSDDAISRLTSTVQTLVAQVEELTAALTQEKKVTAELAEEIRCLRQDRSVAPSSPSRILGDDGPHRKVTSLLPYGCPPNTLFKRSKKIDELVKEDHELSYLVLACDILRSAVNVAAKDRIAVVEHLTDDRSRTDDFTKEKSLCDAICTAAKIPVPLSVWRQKSNSQHRARPLKVEFANVKQRDLFLVNFHKSLISLPADVSSCFAGRHPSCRRDLSPLELQLLYKLRKKCWELNQEAGRRVFVVRDLRLEEYKPRREQPQQMEAQ
jgi:hypothetical protein